eukprot:Stramenopile-MAST_4_protein_4426
MPRKQHVFSKRHTTEQTAGVAGLEKILELDEARAKDIALLNRYVKTYHEEEDVFSCIYREEWRARHEKKLAEDIRTSKIFLKTIEQEFFKSGVPEHTSIKSFSELQGLISQRRLDFSRTLRECLCCKENYARSIQRVVKYWLRGLHEIVKVDASFSLRQSGHLALVKFEELRKRNTYFISGEGIATQDLTEAERTQLHIDVLKDVIIIQATARRWLAARSIERLRYVSKIARRNRRRIDWVNSQGGKTIMDRRYYRLIHDEMVAWYVNVKNECARIENEMTLEQTRMLKSWSKWDNKMTKICMEKPLAKDWLPQLDTKVETESIVSYLNLRTGKTQEEHPHMRYVKSYRKREFSKATNILNDRLARLVKYRNSLLESEKLHRASLSDKALFVLIDGQLSI